MIILTVLSFKKQKLSQVLLVVLHNPPLHVLVLLRDEHEGGEVGVVGVVLDHVVAALGWKKWSKLRSKTVFLKEHYQQFQLRFLKRKKGTDFICSYSNCWISPPSFSPLRC